MPARLLYSGELVNAQAALTREAAAALPATEQPVYQAVARLPEGANQGIDSYLRQLRRRLGALGLEYEEIRNVSAGEAADRLREQHGRPGAAIVMTPDNEVDMLREVLAEDPARDGDAMSAAGLEQRWPATPRAMRHLAESQVGDLRNVDPDRIAVVGANGEVNSGLLAWLALDGIVPGIQIDRKNSDAQRPHLHRNADLVFSATGRASLLTAGDLLRRPSDGRNALPMVVIDAGVSLNRNTGTTHGDVDPHLYSYPGEQDIIISPSPVIFPDGHVQHPGGGVGRLTVEGFIAGGVMPVPGPLTAPAPIRMA